MDQDAFRDLLTSSQQSQSSRKQAGVTTSNVPHNAKAVSSSQPAFKPRKVRKTESKYRDRAAERREGVGNDYAEVEAVLEDFERRAAHEDKDVVEQQRKYLGGDSDHTVLVKGLDMSLLEQNRVRAAASVEDDEILEQAFSEATFKSEPPSRKRTREDIIRGLKANRPNGDKPPDQSAVPEGEEDGSALEAAKKVGKFKPIGFKPIGHTEERSNKRKTKEGKEGSRKKRQKVGDPLAKLGTKDEPSQEIPAVSRESSTVEPLILKPSKPQESELAPLAEDFDIFAGVGDYEGFPAGEDSEDEHRAIEDTLMSSAQVTISPAPAGGTKGWFDDPEPKMEYSTSVPPERPLPISDVMATAEESQEMHLKPLESSTLPSIRDFLAMDEAVEKAEKRKARKEKKKRKKKTDDDE